MPEFQSTGKMAKRDFNEFDSNRTALYFTRGKMGVQKQGQKSTFILFIPTHTLRIFQRKKTESVGKKIKFFYPHFHFILSFKILN